MMDFAEYRLLFRLQHKGLCNSVYIRLSLAVAWQLQKKRFCNSVRQIFVQCSDCSDITMDFAIGYSRFVFNVSVALKRIGL